MMNLMINGIDAMKDVDGARELAIKAQKAQDDRVLVSVSDTGVGLPVQQADQIFKAFFTTKPQGTRMGRSISHSIVESPWRALVDCRQHSARRKSLFHSPHQSRGKGMNPDG
jgi:C4-dicarboxylate-specific signal transduction histidine kinase